MANANLMNANAAMVQADSYNVGTDIANQFGKVMAAQEAFTVKLNQDATEASENLSTDAVGVDLMSDEAREWTTGEFDRLGMEIATARANGNKAQVRELEMEGADLIAMQGEVGNLLKDHAENKLSNNYSKSADQDMLNMLITKKYTINKVDGKYRVMFDNDPNMDLNLEKDKKFNSKTKTGGFGLDTNEVTGLPFENPNAKNKFDNIENWDKEMAAAVSKGDEKEIHRLEMKKERMDGKGHRVNWQKEGVLLSDLDKHIRVKDDGQADLFSEQLEKIGSNSGDNKDYNVVKNETQRLITETIDTTDKLQTALFDNSFSQNNKTLAQIYAEENNLSEKDAFAMLRSSGSEYIKNEEAIRQWTNGKLNQAAENHHNTSSPSYGEMTNSQKKDQATVATIDTFFNTRNQQGGDIHQEDLNKLNNSSTKFKTASVDGVQSITVEKWSNGAWVLKDSYPQNMDTDVLKEMFAEELGMQSYNTYSSNKITN